MPSNARAARICPAVIMKQTLYPNMTEA